MIRGIFQRKRIVPLLIAAGLITILVVSPLIYTVLATRGERYDVAKTAVAQVPFHKVALVLGAGVLPDNTPTPYLRNRIETAARLYKAHRVQILLMSGDNSTKRHNEPVVMRMYAMKLGVKKKDIVLDYAGFNTYDSCYRARAIFGLHDATIISQGYHLPRAMITCKGLGVANTGVAAQHHSRDYTVSYIAREFLSTDKMVIQDIFKPKPTALGKTTPIK